MERRARCRLCNELVTYTDPNILGYHLLTEHPSFNPLYFSVTDNKTFSFNSGYFPTKSSSKLSQKSKTPPLFDQECFPNNCPFVDQNDPFDKASFKSTLDPNLFTTDTESTRTEDKLHKSAVRTHFEDSSTSSSKNRRENASKNNSKETIAVSKKETTEFIYNPFKSSSKVCDESCPRWKQILFNNLPFNKSSTSKKTSALKFQTSKTQIKETENQNCTDNITKNSNECASWKTTIGSSRSNELSKTNIEDYQELPCPKPNKSIVKIKNNDIFVQEHESGLTAFAKKSMSSAFGRFGKRNTSPERSNECKCNLYKTTVTSWKAGSKYVLCPHCQKQVKPMVRKQRNKLTRHSLAATFLLGCWPLCFLCPFGMNRQSRLYCPACRKIIGLYDMNTGKANMSKDPNLCDNNCVKTK